ncbi:MAG: hypothetical protein H7Y04_02615 [Verrucomicrobia bacterium]|nr:hypothetical protein [Cytophagales bacterium]
MQKTKSLWPDFGVDDMVTPSNILKEQAIYLAEKTENIVIAQVKSQPMLVPGYTDNDILAGIKHEFHLVAPALQNYQYKLFHILQGIRPYPLTLTFRGKDYEIKSETEFIKSLENIFSDTETISIIKSLVSQSK